MGADYIFATAHIRSEEKHLLTSEQFRSMTETKKIDEVCKVLQDAGYGTESNALNSDNYEDILRETEKEIFEDIRSLSRENEVFDIFSYPADYHNIKVLLKSEFLGVNRSDILMSSGTIPSDSMVAAVNERNKSAMTEYMGRALDEAIDNHARTKDPQAIDFICDKYCFMDISRVAEKSENDFVKGYVRLWIDTINLRTFVRVRKMEQPWAYFAEVFIPGGNVDLQTFVSCYEEDIKQAAVRFEAYDIHKAIDEGGEAMIKEGTFTTLEKLCDDALMEFVKQAKYITFGLEPMIAYLISRQMEIKCIRVLMGGKAVGMDPQVIRERMRETYE